MAIKMFYGIFVMALIVCYATSYIENMEDMGCLEGRARCLGQTSCKVLLDTMTEVCDTSVTTCQTSERVHCHSVLSSLQRNAYFRHCTCDPIDLDASDCIELQRTIFNHLCITMPPHNITFGRPSHQIPVRVTPYPGQIPGGNLPENNSNAPSDEEEDEEGRGRSSCIGMRRECLQTPPCAQAVHDFASCESTDDICASSNVTRCANALKQLRKHAMELFTCPCPMHASPTLERCNGLQEQFANNICTDWVPYYMESTLPYEASYGKLLRKLRIHQPSIAPADLSERSCLSAFWRCHESDVCSQKLQELMSTCHWNRTLARCNRKDCLYAIQQFYLMVKPDYSLGLLYCQCPAGSPLCLSVKQSLQTTCSIVDTPPPVCSQQLQRCLADPDCSMRWKYYEQYCAVNETTGACVHKTNRCQAAYASTIGTIIHTNCLCTTATQVDFGNCEHSRRRMQYENACLVQSKYDSVYNQPTTKPERQAPNQDNIITAACSSGKSYDAPVYMKAPLITRQYSNHSACSELCYCNVTGSFLCNMMHCPAAFPCRIGPRLYTHGALFNLRHRGHCRCIHSEIVCAKSLLQMDNQAGLFLQVGYSVSEQNLIESQSPLVFSNDRLTQKLSAIVNGESTQQVCILTLEDYKLGNFKFKITPISRIKGSFEMCMTRAQSLENYINTRHRYILIDAELSVLKVSQLQQVRFQQSFANTAPHYTPISGTACRLLVPMSLYVWIIGTVRQLYVSFQMQIFR